MAIEFFTEEYLPKQARATKHIQELLEIIETANEDGGTYSVAWSDLAETPEKAANRLRAHAGHLGYGAKVRPAPSNPVDLLAFEIGPKQTRGKKVQ